MLKLKLNRRKLNCKSLDISLNIKKNNVLCVIPEDYLQARGVYNVRYKCFLCCPPPLNTPLNIKKKRLQRKREREITQYREGFGCLDGLSMVDEGVYTAWSLRWVHQPH